MSNMTIINGGIALHSFIDASGKKPIRVHKCAMLPKELASGWEGRSLHILHWKMNGETASIRYQIHNEPTASIFDAAWLIVDERNEEKPPTRSRNWKFIPDSIGGPCWKNIKTGERVYL